MQITKKTDRWPKSIVTNWDISKRDILLRLLSRSFFQLFHWYMHTSMWRTFEKIIRHYDYTRQKMLVARLRYLDLLIHHFLHKGTKICMVLTFNKKTDWNNYTHYTIRRVEFSKWSKLILLNCAKNSAQIKMASIS